MCPETLWHLLHVCTIMECIKVWYKKEIKNIGIVIHKFTYRYLFKKNILQDFKYTHISISTVGIFKYQGAFDLGGSSRG